MARHYTLCRPRPPPSSCSCSVCTRPDGARRNCIDPIILGLHQECTRLHDGKGGFGTAKKKPLSVYSTLSFRHQHRPPACRFKLPSSDGVVFTLHRLLLRSFSITTMTRPWTSVLVLGENVEGKITDELGENLQTCEAYDSINQTGPESQLWTGLVFGSVFTPYGGWILHLFRRKIKFYYLIAVLSHPIETICFPILWSVRFH